MGVKLVSASAGSVELVAPATASNYTATMPAATGNVVLDSATQTLTNKTIQGGAITSGTAVASTSGTSIDFTGIPSWVKRITVMFSGVSTSGTSATLIQLGYSTSSLQTTGYTGSADEYATTPASNSISQAGFPIVISRTAAYTTSGALTINLLGSNTWCMSSWLSSTPGRYANCLGYVTVAGTVDRVRITTVNGTDTFDAGTINILYE